MSATARALGVALLAAGLLAFAAAAGWAHAIVRETEPPIGTVVAEPPERVAMWFNEPVEIAFGAIRVFDANGARVDEGRTTHLRGRADAIAVALADDLPTGTYTVAWRVISADSHPVSEAFLFHVGAPGAQPRGLIDEVLSGEGGAGALEGVLLGVARWALFAGLLALAGVAAFWRFVWRGRRLALVVRPPEVDAAFDVRARRIAVLAWSVAVAATVASVVFQGAVAGDLPVIRALEPSVLAEVVRTRFGRVAVTRLALLGALALAWRALPLVVPERPRSDRAGAGVGAAVVHAPLRGWPAAVLGAVLLALLVTVGLAGHAGTTPPVGVNLALDTLHLAGAAAWVGGLVVLLAAAFPATRHLDEAGRVHVLAPVVRRFSLVALVSVAVVVATGSARAWAELGALRAVTGSTYGWVLVTKVAVFTPLLGLGAFNHLWARPRLQRAADAGAGAPALTSLRRSVATETLLAAAVLAVTVVLVNLPPGRVAAGVTGPAVIETTLADNRMQVVVDPNEVGENLIHITVTDPSGVPADIASVEVLFRMPTRDIGPIPARGVQVGTGHFVVQGHELSVPGRWELEIVASLDRFTDVRTVVHVVVNR